MANATEVYHIALSTAVGLTCVLSMFGSGAIIVSFIAFRELRTTMRYLLFNLSIADFIVAVTNLFGSMYSLRYLKKPRNNETDIPCVVQAGVGLIGVDASIIWTVVFIVYIYMFLVCCRPRTLKNYTLLAVITVISWMLPTVVVIVYWVKRYFGYQSTYSPGFCTILTEGELVRGIVGYGAFLYFSFTILPIFSVIFFAHLCYISKRNATYDGLERYTRIIRATEMKLILVPVLFLLIRVWGLILDILTSYLKKEQSHRIEQQNVDKAIVFLAGIGDSAQGFLNGMLFVLLTHSVRQRLIYGCLKVFCCFKKTTHVTIQDEDASIVSTFSYRGSVTSIQQAGDIEGSDVIFTGKHPRSLSQFSSDIPYVAMEKENKLVHESVQTY